MPGTPPTAPDSSAPLKPPAPAPALTRTVLVCDDEELIRSVVVDALEEEGYRVVQAANGREALDALDAPDTPDAHAPSLVLLDMRMPVLDGWGFMREYRLRPGPHVPVVVMTAAQNARQWCEEAGGDACLPKPFDITKLLDTVDRLAS